MKEGKQLIASLLSTTYTKADLYYKTELIKEFLEHVFFKEGETRKDINMEHFKDFLQNKNIDEHISRILPEIVDFTIFKTVTSQTLYGIIINAKGYIETLHTTTLYVPVVFSREEIKKIGEWFRNTISKTTMLSIRVDPLVVGGCAFVWNGTYYNFSFHYFIQKKHKEFLSLVHDTYHTYEASRTRTSHTK